MSQTGTESNNLPTREIDRTPSRAASRLCAYKISRHDKMSRTHERVCRMENQVVFPNICQRLLCFIIIVN